jgi:hypothetical protein
MNTCFTDYDLCEFASVVMFEIYISDTKLLLIEIIISKSYGRYIS